MKRHKGKSKIQEAKWQEKGLWNNSMWRIRNLKERKSKVFFYGKRKKEDWQDKIYSVAILTYKKEKKSLFIYLCR